jgi:hypothetical protein
MILRVLGVKLLRRQHPLSCLPSQPTPFAKWGSAFRTLEILAAEMSIITFQVDDWRRNASASHQMELV